MITNKLISITDLRQNATHIIKDIANIEKIVVVHNRPKAAIIHIKDYEAFKRFAAYQDLLEHVIFLAENASLMQLNNEPNLYEQH